MEFKECLAKELVKNGYSEREGGGKIWSVADRSLLYITPEQAESFLKMRKHPRYRKTITDIESDLIKKSSGKIMEWCSGESCNVIDMGCGDGKKAMVFLESLKGAGKIRFCPVSPNKALVDLALSRVKEKNFSNVTGYESCVSSLSSLNEVASVMRNGEYRENVILLLGSILASFEIHDFLFKLSNAMLPGDHLIIGNGIRTGERLANLETYKHKLFESWLAHSVRGLGFKDDEVEYDARFENGRVETFFRSLSISVIVFLFF